MIESVALYIVLFPVVLMIFTILDYLEEWYSKEFKKDLKLFKEGRK